MIVNRQRRISVAVRPLEEFCERASRALRFPSDAVAIQFISDSAMARLNQTFRHKRGPTDVLSFSANGSGASNAGHRQYMGDIAISLETARRNARLYERSLPDELRVLILHGMIHLAGYDHETDAGEMNRLERRLRARLGVK
jgi:probable rRNA maturation factor